MGLTYLCRGQKAFAPELAASASRGFKASFCSLRNQISLKLSNHRKDVEDHSALRGRRVDQFVQRSEADVSVRKIICYRDQLFNAAREPIQAPDNQRIVRRKLRQKVLQLRPAILICPAAHLRHDVVTPGRLKGIVL